MRVGIMITNGGPHPADKWAEQTAERIVDIIQVEATSPVYDAALAAKAAFKDAIAAGLELHHDDAQTHERGQLDLGGERLNHDLDPTAHLDAAVQAVLDAAKGTMFELHFAKPQVRDFVRSTVGSHLATVMHIERSWHADKNPDCPHCQAWRARHHAAA
jgi:hypothetical protein